MAVSIQTPLPSKPGMWNLGESPAVYSTSGTNAAPSSMAYQYTLPTSNFEPSSNLIPSFQHPPLDNGQHNHSSTAEPPTPTGSNHPGSSVGSKAAKIKRSMSTPNVRGQATAEAAALALSADKRRNKLGYHRTSVACGHCRRRKIRCIPAPADPQNRCSNCIRLKKECNFYPVDQQPQPDPRRRGSKSQSGTGRASESTSPTTSSGQLPEMSTSLPYPPLNMPPIQDLGGPQMKRQRTESFSPDNKVVTSSRNFEFNHGPTNWMAPDASPGIKHQGDASQSFWRQNAQDSPLTPAFSPFTPSLQIPPSQNWPTPHTEPSPRDDMNWPVPTRSISYSNIEGLHHPQHQQYAPSYTQSPTTTVPENYTTKPSRVQQHPGMYPPPTLSSSTGSMMAPTTSATTNEPLPHPQSANSLPPTAFSNWPQPYYQKPVGSSSEAYAGWNAHHEAHPRPVPSQYSNDAHPPAPAPAYGYPEHQGQMYYQGPPHPGHPGR